ncbi:RagB/SusD family nutrient uptake outer membrane protein [Catalinimonas niigatensis]|uniref:RagB/SusD family nutrient uptake outer membrane protein n=1 Tax=Catalinimonas niigatensis TaxID=1397264 RepID=UPI002665C8F7|nr:RagB/SusD family nutrient uptake outer membrane protein [Catalinimonas niigatensis]WPP51108.1 RagB/SusD family nutrient uptake outer membrane protein [Catalinimonas niigatensis]
MKKYNFLYTILLAGILTLSYTSCSEEFLDEEPLGIPSSASLFADEAGAIRATNGIYAHLRNWDVLGFPYFGIKELPSDDADVGSTPGDGSYPRLELINTFTYDPTVVELNGYWVGSYRGVNRANQVIYNVPDIEMDEELKARLIAEARFLRAFYYFNLVRAFGEVPIIDKIYTDPEDARNAVGKSPVEDVYNFILEDLNAAVGVLPLKSDYPVSELGRATRGAAQAMLAKVYLFRQDYANARDNALAVIQSGEYELYPDYRALFFPEQENGVESIFEAQVIDRDDRAIANEFTKWQGVRGQFGWGFNSPTESLSNAYEEGDPRRTATIFYSGDTLEGANEPYFLPINEGAMPRANKKALLPLDMQPPGYPENSPSNFIFLRYADVLLIYAEAANELGQPAEALPYLNMVRERARSGNPDVLPDITTTSQAELREIIWHERRVELAMEGHRFFDLIRQDAVEPGRAAAVFQAAGKTNFDINRHANFPVPQEQVDVSAGALTQDENW